MVGYLDSSVALRHLLLGDISIKHVMEYPRIISSELLKIECFRVFHRCRMEKDFDDSGFTSARERLENLLESVELLELSPAVKQRSLESFPVSLKTLDALHLSSALLFAVEASEDIVVFSYDTNMNRCARALGFTVPFRKD